jgi:asparagine synthase (glutamine-hydrolysing)
MCGICGTAGFAEQRQLDAMNSAIVHHGPDDGGVQVICNGAGTPWIGLANRRLSIIDLPPAGHQPMCNEDGSI